MASRPQVRKTIWLIRHGESAANAGLPTLSAESIPLTERGHGQAQRVAGSFSGDPSLIVTSPFLRARQTALPTIERFPLSQVEQRPVQEFTYLHLGDRGETTANDRRPLVEEYWKRGDVEHCDGDQAESFVSFIQRVEHTIRDIKASKYETIAVDEPVVSVIANVAVFSSVLCTLTPELH
jgi:broad specificity phosphatase PhoE